jgi:hypothetical protein
MEKKYIMAQINIPIEILSNGQTRPHVQCAQIAFSPCDQLPPEHDNPNQFIMEKLSTWLQNDRAPPPPPSDESDPCSILSSLVISKEDIERTPKTRGHTITFKNYPKAIRSRNLTEKNR